MSRCQQFGISSIDCAGSIYVPSKEYDDYVKSFNLPIQRDPECNRKNCSIVVYKEPPRIGINRVPICQGPSCFRPSVQRENSMFNPYTYGNDRPYNTPEHNNKTTKYVTEHDTATQTSYEIKTKDKKEEKTTSKSPQIETVFSTKTKTLEPQLSTITIFTNTKEPEESLKTKSHEDIKDKEECRKTEE